MAGGGGVAAPTLLHLCCPTRVLLPLLPPLLLLCQTLLCPAGLAHPHQRRPATNCSLQHLCPAQTCRHGICLDSGHGGECFCEDGFTGLYCETDADDCLSSPCLHGGTCSDLVRGYSCYCYPGFAGHSCQHVVSACAEAMCQNGASCVWAAHGAACLCPPGFSGVRCETDISVCHHVTPPHVRCHNGGQCLDGPANTYRCICQPGFTGATCLVNIDECASSPCQNGGSCLDQVDGFQCSCPVGFSGRRCQTKLHNCQRNVCENDALCVRTGIGPACLCRPDFHGHRCHLQYNDCQPEPRCLHGGICVDGVNSFRCQCPALTSGQYCQCVTSQNGSFCVAPEHTAARVAGLHSHHVVTVDYQTVVRTSVVATQYVQATPVVDVDGLAAATTAASASTTVDSTTAGIFPSFESVGPTDASSTPTIPPSPATSELFSSSLPDAVPSVVDVSTSSLRRPEGVAPTASPVAPATPLRTVPSDLASPTPPPPSSSLVTIVVTPATRPIIVAGTPTPVASIEAGNVSSTHVPGDRGVPSTAKVHEVLPSGVWVDTTFRTVQFTSEPTTERTVTMEMSGVSPKSIGEPMVTSGEVAVTTAETSAATDGGTLTAPGVTPGETVTTEAFSAGTRPGIEPGSQVEATEPGDILTLSQTSTSTATVDTSEIPTSTATVDTSEIPTSAAKEETVEDSTFSDIGSTPDLPTYPESGFTSDASTYEIKSGTATSGFPGAESTPGTWTSPELSTSTYPTSSPPTGVTRMTEDISTREFASPDASTAADFTTDKEESTSEYAEWDTASSYLSTDVAQPTSLYAADASTSSQFSTDESYISSDFSTGFSLASSEFSTEDEYTSSLWSTDEVHVSPDLAPGETFTPSDYTTEVALLSSEFTTDKAYTSSVFTSSVFTTPREYASSEFTTEESDASSDFGTKAFDPSEFSTDGEYTSSKYATEEVYTSGQLTTEETYGSSEPISEDWMASAFTAEEAYTSSQFRTEETSATPMMHQTSTLPATEEAAVTSEPPSEESMWSKLTTEDPGTSLELSTEETFATPKFTQVKTDVTAAYTREHEATSPDLITAGTAKYSVFTTDQTEMISAVATGASTEQTYGEAATTSEIRKPTETPTTEGTRTPFGLPAAATAEFATAQTISSPASMTSEPSLTATSSAGDMPPSLEPVTSAVSAAATGTTTRRTPGGAPVTWRTPSMRPETTFVTARTPGGAAVTWRTPSMTPETTFVTARTPATSAIAPAAPVDTPPDGSVSAHLPIRFFPNTYLLLESEDDVRLASSPPSRGRLPNDTLVDDYRWQDDLDDFPPTAEKRREMEPADSGPEIAKQDAEHASRPNGFSEDGKRVKLRISFATLSEEGAILASLPTDVPPWFRLFLRGGLLRLEFSCSGRQATSFIESQAKVNTGHKVTVHFVLRWLAGGGRAPQCRAAMRLSGSPAMSAQQFADRPLDRRVALIIGSLSSRGGFDGYLLDLQVNDKLYEQLSIIVADSVGPFKSPCEEAQCRSGSTCVPLHWLAATCQCRHGFSGQRCDTALCDRERCGVGAQCALLQSGRSVCLCPFGRAGDDCQAVVSFAESRYHFHGSPGGPSSYLAVNVTSSLRHQFWLFFHLATNNASQTALLALLADSDPSDSATPVMIESFEAEPSGQRGASPGASTGAPEHPALAPPGERVSASRLWRDVRGDFFAVSLSRGYVTVTWQLGSGARRLMSEAPLDDKMTVQTVRVGRRARRVWLQVNTQRTATARSPGLYSKLDVSRVLYVGGHDELQHNNLPGDLKAYGGFSGCLFDLRLGAYSYRGAAPSVWRGRHVTACRLGRCQAGPHCPTSPAASSTSSAPVNASSDHRPYQHG